MSRPDKPPPLPQALAKYAFGIGSLQMLICVGSFSLFALPPGNSIGSTLLQYLAHAPPSLVCIRSVDEVRTMRSIAYHNGRVCLEL